MIAYTQSIRHDGQSGIDRSARWEKAAVHDVKIFQIVRLAIDVECGGLGVATEANRTVLVRDARQRDALATIEIAAKETLAKDALMAVVAVNRAIRLLHCLLEFRLQPSMSLEIVRCVAEHDLAVTSDFHAIVRIRKILGRKPEVQRV